MSAPYWDIPNLWEHLALPSDPFPWNFDTAVKRVQIALDELGGIEGLYKDEIPVHYVMASNWVYDREQEALGAVPVSHKLRTKFAKCAKRDPEAWDAMVIIIATSMNGHYDEAYRFVNRTIGERPGKSKGYKAKIDMQRNAFIVDWIEILQDAGGMKLKEAYAVLAKVLKESIKSHKHKPGSSEEAIRKGRETYQRMMKELNPEPEDDHLRDEWNRAINDL